MVFFALIIIAIGLYVWDYKIPALLIFFFFMTSGFNLIPEEMLMNNFFSKGMDYAILIIAGMVLIDSLYIKNYLKPDRIIWLIFIFFIFLVICVFYNKYIIGTSWTEIVRTARYNILWIAYLVFRNLPKEKLISLLKCLFLITVICALLYLLQIILDEHILNKTVKYRYEIFDMVIPRFYNQPDMLQIFTFMAIFYNPYKGLMKIITTALLVMALLGAFHRSLLIAFILAVSTGYIIRLPRVKRVIILTIISVLGSIFIVFLGYKFTTSRTFKDIAIVMSGNLTDLNVEDLDIEVLQESTFTFRISHLIERNQYLLEHPEAMLFGAGLMTEDSKLTDSIFDFSIGLHESTLEKTAQLDTADISYSILFMRYGYLGTLIILSIYIFLMSYFYKNSEDPFGLFSFVYFIVVVVGTFFSYILILPISFLLPLITYCIIQKNKSE